MIKDFAFLRRPLDTDTPKLIEGAAQDQHIVLPPAYVVEKQGEPVGYFHLQNMALAWLSTRRCTARDTFHLMNTIENIHAPVAWPVPVQSPMHEHMEALGYKNMGSFTLWMRV